MSVAEVVSYILVCDWCSVSIGQPSFAREDVTPITAFCSHACSERWHAERAAQTDTRGY